MDGPLANKQLDRPSSRPAIMHVLRALGPVAQAHTPW